ncbi:MAG: DNA primase [Leptospira sp.]|nr:DNA primase [Leptospira sp.]
MSNSDFKERIRRELPIESYISRFVNLKKAGKNFLGLCPFHSEKTPSFNVSPEKGYYHCFGCKASGDIFRFTMDYHKVDFVRSMEILSEHSGIPLDSAKTQVDKDRDKKKEECYRLNQKVSEFFIKNLFDHDGKHALNYLLNRGLTEEEISKFDIGFAPEGFQNLKGKILNTAWEETLGIELGILKRNEKGNVYDFYRNRVMFPIRDASGRVVGFSGRTLSDDPREAKYVNSPNSLVYDKSRQVYNLFLAQDEIRNLRSVVLVEGVMDAIGLFTRGIKNVVAPLGTSFTNYQARILKNLSDQVTLLLDGDEAGKKGAIRAAEILLREGIECKIALADIGSDPFDLSRKLSRSELRLFLDEGKNSWNFLVESALNGANSTSDPDTKKKAIHSLFQFTKKWDKETDRQIFLNQGSKVLGITTSAILEDFRKETEQFGVGFSDNTKRDLREVPRYQRPINKGAMECERSLLAKMVVNPDLFRYAGKVDDLEFQDGMSVVLWEWMFTQYHMGEIINEAEVLSSDTLAEEVREGFAPFLLQEEYSEDENLTEIFEELIMLQRRHYHSMKMDEIIMKSHQEQDDMMKISELAYHKGESEKINQYFRNKSIVNR